MARSYRSAASSIHVLTHDIGAVAAQQHASLSAQARSHRVTELAAADQSYTVEHGSGSLKIAPLALIGLSVSPSELSATQLGG